MPNRVIRESARRSETLAKLTGDEERLFWRLTTAADDFGRFDGRPAVIRAECFQVMLDVVTEHDVATWLAGLEKAGLVRLYRHDGKPYLHFTTWEKYQQTRAKESKWPAPPTPGVAREQPLTSANVCVQTQADSFGNESGSGIESEERGARAGEARSPTVSLDELPGAYRHFRRPVPFPVPWECGEPEAAEIRRAKCGDPPHYFGRFVQVETGRAVPKLRTNWWQEFCHFVAGHDPARCSATCRAAGGRKKPAVDLVAEAEARRARAGGAA